MNSNRTEAERRSRRIKTTKKDLQTEWIQIFFHFLYHMQQLLNSTEITEADTVSRRENCGVIRAKGYKASRYGESTPLNLWNSRQ